MTDFLNHGLTYGRFTSVLLISTLVSACTTAPQQSSVTHIEQTLAAQYPALNISADTLGDSTKSASLDKTLTLPQAIQTMLTHSPQVRTQLAQLGIADAEALQAELIDNPSISIGALRSEDGGRWQLDTGLSQPLLELFTRPLRRQLAQENVLQTQLDLQLALQTLIAQTSERYFSAVAAMQHCVVQYQMVEATKARQQLALSLYRAGNLSENTFLSYDNELRRSQQQLEKRQTVAYEKRLQLLNLMGLPSSQSVDIATQLPVLPTEKFQHAALLDQAKENRADIKIAQQQLTLTDKRLQLISKENGWRDMHVGINAEREFDGAVQYGPEVEFALPLFNRGQGKIAAIDAQKKYWVAHLHQLELDADSAIAQAINTMNSARIQLKHLESSLDVAEKRVELSNREVNFMLASPFELLSIKRQQIQIAHEFTEQQKNYWKARAQLELALGKSLEINERKGHQEHHHD
jgi:cobalt-zinc-cadmium efflux system outer membrane protein